jgi:hypothetical protein
MSRDAAASIRDGYLERLTHRRVIADTRFCEALAPA